MFLDGFFKGIFVVLSVCVCVFFNGVLGVCCDLACVGGFCYKWKGCILIGFS